jgi:hypothetical protein
VLTNKISARSDSWFGLQGAKTKNTKSAIFPELMAGSSTNLHYYVSLVFIKRIISFMCLALFPVMRMAVIGQDVKKYYAGHTKIYFQKYM